MNLLMLRGAHDYASISHLFEISATALKAELYGSDGHYVFSIPKKSGGTRTIASPTARRKTLQQKLKPILDEAYKPRSCVNGFIKNKNVRSNAVPHVAKRTLINVDLKDFFPTISFQRVRGIFLAQPFGFSWPTANILAQICCYNGALSTGGVTSPTISNIACARLDKRLEAMVGRLGGDYTRYADDISLSFDRPIKQLSTLVTEDSAGNLALGSSLSEIISSEGFKANLDKLRVSANNARKMVTGLVVNEKTNVRRKWYSAVESSVYAAEKFGVNAVAQSVFPEIPNTDVAQKKFLRRLHGKIAYLRMVRGRGDWVSSNLAFRFNRLHSHEQLRISSVEVVSREDRLDRACLIVNCSDGPLDLYDAGQDQGTAFVTSSGLIVTAAHVVLGDDAKLREYVYVMNERRLQLIRCEVLIWDLNRDVAILRPSSSNLEIERIRLPIGDDAMLGEDLSAIGYPNYVRNNRASKVACRGVQDILFEGIRKIAVDGAIQGGLSGGPVVDRNCKVRGIVHKGIATLGGVAEVVKASEVLKVAQAGGLTL